MKTLQSFLLASIAIAFIFSGCKKKDSTTDITPSHTTLISKTWKIDKVFLDGMAMTPEEIAMDEGGTNVTNTFTTDGTFLFSLTDSTGTVQSGSGKWVFVNNETGINIFDIPGTAAETSTIITLTADHLSYWHMDSGKKMEMYWILK